jgi:hypothetical protein
MVAMSERPLAPLSQYVSYDQFVRNEESKRGESDLALPLAETKPQVAARAEKSWLKRHWLPLSIGVLLSSSIVSFASTPGSTSGTINKIKHQPRWLLDSFVASTSLYLSGAALVGKGSFKGMQYLSHGEITAQFKSNLFENHHVRSGLFLNTVGALGNAGLAATVVLTSLPGAESIGACGAIGLDLAGSLLIRSGIISALREHDQEPIDSAGRQESI